MSKTDPDGTPDPTPNPRRRRWRALSLRMMMLLVLVLGGVLGWVTRAARIQRQAVEAIKRSGGFAYYDYQYLEGGAWFKAKSRALRPLRRWLGDDYFDTVVEVQTFAPTSRWNPARNEFVIDRSREIPNKDRVVIHALASLPRLRRLSLTGIRIDDNGLEQLARMSDLEDLTLYGDALTDDGLAHLKKLAKLQALYISDNGPGAPFQRGIADLQADRPSLKVFHFRHSD